VRLPLAPNFCLSPMEEFQCEFATVVGSNVFLLLKVIGLRDGAGDDCKAEGLGEREGEVGCVAIYKNKEQTQRIE
jgi:hypothetical protein